MSDEFAVSSPVYAEAINEIPRPCTLYNSQVEPFGNGFKITLSSPDLKVELLTFGASLNSVKVRNPHTPLGPESEWIEVCLGFNDPVECQQASSIPLSGTCGRFAGRIANGEFDLHGVNYKLMQNWHGHTLHGGPCGFHQKEWRYLLTEGEDEIGVSFHLISPHLDQGFPGELFATATYTISKNSGIKIQSNASSSTNNLDNALFGSAHSNNTHSHTGSSNNNNNANSSDNKVNTCSGSNTNNINTTITSSCATGSALLKYVFQANLSENSPVHSTVVNLTNHAYWNLNGVPRAAHSDDICPLPEPITNHYLQLRSKYSAETDEDNIPHGEMMPTEGTVHDYTKLRCICDGMLATKEQGRDDAWGYDDPIALDTWDSSLREAAVLYCPKTKLRMRVCTTNPVIVVYTANFLPIDANGSANKRFQQHSGICLECQYFPNSPNVSSFPSTELRKGETYEETTTHEFRFLSAPPV